MPIGPMPPSGSQVHLPAFAGTARRNPLHMIGSIAKAFKSVFGDKYQRDLKEVMPLVERVKEEFAKLSGLSNNDLRQRAQDLRARIAARTKANDDRVAALRGEIDADPRMEMEES